MYQITREQVAHHESSHAVCACVLFADYEHNSILGTAPPFTDLDIVSVDGERRGQVNWSEPYREAIRVSSDSDFLDRVLMTGLAGKVGDETFYTRLSDVFYSNDHAISDRLCSEMNWDREAKCDELIPGVRNLIIREGDAIHGVAKALLEADRLDFEQVCTILERWETSGYL